MVFYRKYRPQKISDLDNAQVREKLFSVLSGESVSHAFLFTGPKGLGKTSTARIVAKTVNCETNSKRKSQNLENVEPCNKCEQCISITNGTNLDVLEIDGASNRGIDEIRDLREKIRLSPIRGKKKVYIIDEVHMLTTEAFNALLKTLEEPPSHAIFILCTTEPHKVPSTISSRCFHIAFTRATNDELVHSFKRILKGEGLEADDEALGEVAKLSDGSFRDGAKILEEVVVLAKDKKITKELVESKYQVTSIKYQVDKLLSFLAQKDAKTGLELISKLIEQGIDMKYFVEQLINELHQQLLIQVGIKSSELRIQNSELNLEFRIDEIKTLVELLTKAHQDIKYAVLPQLPLELVVVEWSMGEDYAGLPHAERDAKASSQSAGVRGPAAPSSNPASSLTPFAAGARSDTPGGRVTPRLNENFVSSPHQDKNDTDLLYQIIDAVKSQNQSVAGLLRGCKIKSIDDKNLVLETLYKFHKEKLEDKSTIDLLEKAILQITGNKSKVLVVLKDR